MFILFSILLWFMGFNALESGLSSFAVFSLGMEAGDATIAAGSITVSFILSALPAGLIGARLGRKTAIQIGLAGLVGTTLLGYFFIKSTVAFVVILVVSGILWALVNVNSLPLVYDHGDEKRIGAYTGLYYFSSQLAAVLGPTLSGVVVQMLGSEYRWLWLFSMVFMALAVASMLQVRPAPLPAPAPAD